METFPIEPLIILDCYFSYIYDENKLYNTTSFREIVSPAKWVTSGSLDWYRK